MRRRSRHTPVVLVVLLVAALAPASMAWGADPVQPTTKAECKKGGWQDFTNAGFRNQGDCIKFVQTGEFTCRDPLGCVSYGEEDPLRLATALATSGPTAFLGIDELRGVEIALDGRGPVLGHVVELSNFDSLCSAEGGESAANAIVADPTIAAVVGTTCSAAAVTAAPIVSNAGLSMVSPSNTSPALTAPDTHAAGYLRVAGNDADQGVTMAGFVWGEGAATSAVIVEQPAPEFFEYQRILGEAFAETFEALGGANLAFEVAEPDGSDVAEVIAAVIDAGIPNVLYLSVFESLGSALVAEVRATPEFDETQLAAIETLFTPEFVNEVGVDAEGMLFTIPDPSFTETPEYALFADAYLTEFGEDPLTLFSALAYDATNVVLNGIEEAGIVDDVGTLHIGRQALRDALFATDGFEGLTGLITCDPLGDCGAHGYAVRSFAPLVVWTYPEYVAGLTEAAELFTMDTGIDVIIEAVDISNLEHLLSQAGDNGEGPDVFVAPHDWTGRLVEGGLVEPIDLTSVASEFEPVATQAFLYGGAHWGLPIAVEATALFYNADLVAAPPATFETLGPSCASMVGIENCVGLSRPDAYFHYPFLTAFGGYVFGFDPAAGYDPSDVGLDSPGAIAGAQFLEAQVQAGAIGPIGEYDLIRDLFLSGVQPYWITGPWELDALMASGLDWDVAPIPTMDGNVPGPFVGVHGLFRGTYGEQEADAAFLLDYIATTEAMIALFNAGAHRPPAHLEAHAAVADEVTEVIMQSVAVGESMPNIPEMYYAWFAMADAFDAIRLGTLPADEAMIQAAQAVRDAIKS